MIINVRKSGGFAGIEQELGTIDTSTLSGERSARIEARVADLARSLAKLDEPIGADMPRYEIAVQDETGKRRSFTIVEDDPANLPAPVRELLAEL